MTDGTAKIGPSYKGIFGKEVELAFVNIDNQACTGCGLCVQPCAPDAIQHVARHDIPIHIVKT